MKHFLSPSFRSQLLPAICGNIVAFSHGATVGWLSPFLPLLLSDKSPLGAPMTTEETSWVGAIICVGGVIGNFFYRYLSDHFGRKRSMMFLVIPQFTFWVLVYYATEVYHLYIARFSAGLSGGGIFCTVPLYIAGIAEPNVRGSLGSILLLAYNFGVLFTYTLGLYVEYKIFPLVIITIPTIFFVAFYFIPETPQFLLEKNRKTEALESLKFYRGVNRNAAGVPKIVVEEFEKMQTSNTKHMNDDNSIHIIKDFCNKPAILGMSIGFTLMILNQFSGGFLMTNYAAKIFQDAGSSLEPRIASIIVATLQIIGTYVATILSDRAGRKILVVISVFSSSFGLAVMGCFSFLDLSDYDVTAFRLVPVLSLSFVVFIGCIGISTLPFVILAEILPNKIRSVGSAICLATLSGIAFIILKFYPILNEMIEFYGCMWLFATVCFVGGVVICVILPETKGKDLELETSTEVRNKEVLSSKNGSVPTTISVI